VASADSFSPIRLGVKISPVARRHAKLPITIQVSADSGMLDLATSRLRIRAKLASECGGTYEFTPGVVLLDKPLSPQPVLGHAYSATFRGSGKPAAFGQQTVCVFLDESNDQRTFASDQSTLVDVSKLCTTRAHRYDKAHRALVRARHHRRAHPHRFKRAKRKAARAHRRALRACGREIPL
jgi:hypothetical protein